jgi:hypothetical protein
MLLGPNMASFFVIKCPIPMRCLPSWHLSALGVTLTYTRDVPLLKTENGKFELSFWDGVPLRHRKTSRNLQRPRLALTHPTPLYQHLLPTAGERKVSGGESIG